jgi:small subunit ribosomal protein S8
MSMSDRVADMLTRIRNGQKAKFLTVKVPCSKLKVDILKVLKQEGYIAGYEEDETGRWVDVELKYSRSGEPVICEIHRVSRPGRRMYSAISDLKEYYNNMGVYVLSTSKGVMSDRDARRLNVGGEVVCKVF